jgi:hypothetical protein
VLLHDYDIVDEFSANAGLDSVFTDEPLPYDKRYWYAVTSYGIPELRTIEMPWGETAETLRVSGAESPITANMVRVDLSARASDGPGGVAVVPNPSSDDHVTFIHLPRDCTIRIYTVAGDVITTLRYQAPAADPDRGELRWNLVSESGRPLSSDIYVYSVESRFGTQIGKFVAIR